MTAASAVAVTLTAPAAHAITGGTTAGGWNQPLQEVARITIGALQRGCTGTLIAPTWVVTAASCFATDPAQGFLIQPGPPPMPTVVQVGDEASPDKQTMGGGTTGGTANAVQLIPRTDRDVVLVALDRDLGYSGLRVATRPPAAGEQLDIAGFGRTEKDWVPTKLQVAHTSVSSVSPSSVGIAGASSTCRGDAGGPTLRGGVSDNAEVAAIHGPSWQYGCFAETGKNNGATEIRLDDIYPWILQNVPDVRAICSGGTKLLATRGGGAWNSTHLDNTNNLRPLAPLTGTGHWDDLTPVTATDIPALSGTVRQGWGLWEVHRKNGPQDPVADGDLRQTAYRYSDPTATRMTTITAARGWQRFLDPSHSNQITVENVYLEEHIYTIGANGELRLFRWDDFYDKWVNPDGEVIDTGWDKYDSITATGDGVIYARTSDGRLMRFRYDIANHTWTQRDKQIATGWNVFSQIFSPGADILYATGATKNGTPTVRWYQYYPELDTWAPGDPDGLGKIAGQGDRWSSAYQFIATQGTCKVKP